MSTSFVNATRPATSLMNGGGGIVIGTVSASVEYFVHERAPMHGSSSASLSRRRPQSRWPWVRAAVQTPPSRVGRLRRGSTSKSPERLLPGLALRLRALVVPGRVHAVRPNYALERTVIRRRPCSDVRRAAAQRER
jgi:hypothetical protein